VGNRCSLVCSHLSLIVMVMSGIEGRLFLLRVLALCILGSAEGIVGGLVRISPAGLLGLGSGAEVATDSVGMYCSRAFKIELFEF
jgi:hypothetical protein